MNEFMECLMNQMIDVNSTLKNFSRDSKMLAEVVNNLMKRQKKMNFKIMLLGTGMGLIAYSVYVQATKIETLKKELEEIKSEKGE